MTTKITNKNFSSVSNIGVSWQSVIVADGSTATTGVAGRGYFINTTSAAHTFTLPTIATAGDTISIKDYAGTFATNKLTIARNGHNIQGVANNSLIGTNRASVTLVYIDVTRGWEFVKESNVATLGQALFTSATGGTITTSGNFKIHSFTGDGCFVVSSLGNSPTVPTGGPSNVDYLVVAGGGGGGGSIGGGGGAGGYRTTFPSPGCNAGSFPITATTFPITVGAGGSGGGAPDIGGSGSNSIFSTITSAGGGRGGSYTIGVSGGSGGGGAGESNFAGGTGNTPPVSPPQGNNGGTTTGTACTGASGGGGAAAVGTNSPGPKAGRAGGAGSTNNITGSPVAYAGGGGGGSRTNEAPFGAAAGGTGGGGAGGNVTGGVAGTANTGGGGGGGNPGGAAAAGGKGIVIIRYKFQ